MLYEARGLTKTHGSRVVLDLDHLDIEEGSLCAFLGPNGAGKTTLFHILAFLSAPDSGQLLYRGQAVRFTESCLQPLRREAVCVLQNPLMFSRSVYKNVEFGLKIRGVDRRSRKHMIEHSLDMVQMLPFAKAPAHKLSGGETQRVAIARALALSPRVILLDEPTASVDSKSQAAIMEILRRINMEKKITVLFTSHDARWAKNLARRVIHMEDGRLLP